MHAHAMRQCLMRQPLHLQTCPKVDAWPNRAHAHTVVASLLIVVHVARSQHAVLTVCWASQTFVLSAIYCREVH
jgi:hypothetical protein